MRYVFFVIKNFKGIQNLTLDFDRSPNSKVSILVGLNESGKTTIMEALSFFYENIRDFDEKHFTSTPSGITDKHSLIPKNRKDNFSDKTIISANIELGQEQINSLKDILEENSFHADDIPSRMTLGFSFDFENSLYKSSKAVWSHKIKGKEGRKRNTTKLSMSHKAWKPSSTFIKKTNSDNYLLPQLPV